TGYLGIPSFLEPVFANGGESADHHGMAGVGIMIVATAMGVIGIAAAYYVYLLHPQPPDRFSRGWQTPHHGSLHKWYVDEAYDRLFVRPTFTAAAELWRRVDVAVIDGAVNGVARGVAWSGWLLRLIQSGQTQHYALAMAVGVMVIVTMFFVF